jgi:hypothetical protein
MSEIGQRYSVTLCDIRMSNGSKAKLIPNGEYWMLVSDKEKAETEVEQCKEFALGLKEDMFYRKERAGKGESEVERLREALKQIQHDMKDIECRDDIVGIRGYIDVILEKDGAKDVKRM